MTMGTLKVMFFVYIWACTWQNQQNDLCTQRRLRSAWASAQSDQGLCCPHEEALVWVFTGDTGHFVGFVMRRLKCVSVQAVFFGALAMSTLRMKYLWTPYMCILAGFGVADYKAWKTILVQLNTQGIVVCMLILVCRKLCYIQRI